jgi:hypothetical protein
VKTPGIRERRSSGSIADELLRAPIAACRIDIDGSFKKLGKARHPTDRVSDYFEGRKWDQLPDFSADGPDGTTFAYRQNGALPGSGALRPVRRLRPSMIAIGKIAP